MKQVKQIGTWIVYLLLLCSFVFLCFELTKDFILKQEHLEGLFSGKFLPKIEVEKPFQNEKIKSPLFVAGVAGSTWFNKEETFEIELLDESGGRVATGKVFKTDERGEGDKPEMFHFKGSITFRTPKSKTGTLQFYRFKGENYDSSYPDTFSVPVLFEK